MKIQEKMRKPMMEAKYLNVENTERYRPIIRLFYLKYEKLKYWLYQEEVFEELKEDPSFCRIYNDTVSAGSGGFGIMGKPGNNSGYQKGQQY